MILSDFVSDFKHALIKVPSRLSALPRVTSPHHYTKREVLSHSGSCKVTFQTWTRSGNLINHIWKLKMDFGILNLILMDAKLDFNAFHHIFLIFTLLNSCFNENNTKTSQMWKLFLNGKLKSKQKVHHRLSTFLVWEVLLTVIWTGRQKTRQ